MHSDLPSPVAQAVFKNFIFKKIERNLNDEHSETRAHIALTLLQC